MRSPPTQALAIALLLCVLIGLFVWAGAMEPDPERNHHPGTADLAENYDAYVGEYAELNGEVVETDPVVIEAEYGPDQTVGFVVEGIEEPVEPDQRLTVYGLVKPDHTIQAEETVVRDAWERTYMYAVSAFAAAWVFARFVRGWRFDRGTMSFRPRGDHDG